MRSSSPKPSFLLHDYYGEGMTLNRVSGKTPASSGEASGIRHDPPDIQYSIV